MYPFERTVPPLSLVVPMYPLDTFYTFFVSDGYKNHDAGSLARFFSFLISLVDVRIQKLSQDYNNVHTTVSYKIYNSDF